MLISSFEGEQTGWANDPKVSSIIPIHQSWLRVYHLRPLFLYPETPAEMGGEKSWEKRGESELEVVGLTPKFVERDEIRSSIIPPTAIVSILSFFLVDIQGRINHGRKVQRREPVGLSIYRRYDPTTVARGETRKTFSWVVELSWGRSKVVEGDPILDEI